MGAYDQHLENKKWVESENEFKRNQRRGKKIERRQWHNSTSVTVGASQAYRDGWDRLKRKEEERKRGEDS